MIVDVETNVGYLVRENGEYTSFPVMTGQQRTVRYLGRTYFAATPEKKWSAMEKNTQTDRITFGPTGAFLRLYDRGLPTNYGIHGTKYFDQMLAEGNQYRSMGCVLVDEDVLKLVIETFELNRNSLELVTTRNVILEQPKA